MSMDLARDGEGLNYGFPMYILLMTVAEAYGFKPMGTLPPFGIADDAWDSNDYGSNSGQEVRDEDARNLAAALRRAASECRTLTDLQRERVLELADFASRGLYVIM